MNDFKRGALKFLKKTSSMLQDKNPLLSSVVRNSIVFSLISMSLEKREILDQHLKQLLALLSRKKILSIETCDQARTQYPYLLETDTTNLKFSCSVHSIDEYLFEIKGIGRFAAIAEVAKFILTLDHGPVDVERVFSVNRNAIRDNMTL